ncbi:hypothetical protein FA95DRAFT_1572206 [Auriscalpium vulgare]|uniref:Uncharacterized protein n=1 Tax=Auriscalpium vulgare TaxID=40419 RepID=A0ACB8RVJ0_9AGAM|nr:hypothetical protein FA95DRAFT_1572206 [Auriscalpium vulgare]
MLPLSLILTVLGLSASCVSSGIRNDALARQAPDSRLCDQILTPGTDILQSTGKLPLGWMAIGFGHRMNDSPMVIMWPWDNGSVTLSQRTAPYETMPTPDKSPAFNASLSLSATKVSSAASQMAFTRPLGPDSEQPVIWAFSQARPGSADPDTPIARHVTHGAGKLILPRIAHDHPPEAEAASNHTPSSAMQADDAAAPADLPKGFTTSERAIVIHGIIGFIGTSVLIPLGAFWARYAKTVHDAHPTWFRFHWYIQFAGAVFIVVAASFGYRSVSYNGRAHFDDFHKLLGGALLVLVGAQLVLGTLVHRSTDVVQSYKRTMQHRTLGVVIIAGCFLQLRIGSKREWPSVTGTETLIAFSVAWWTVVLFWPALELLVLVVIPRFKERREERADHGDLALESVPLRAGDPEDV